jgi:uncharacterized protein YdeI (BOF family)
VKTFHKHYFNRSLKGGAIAIALATFALTACEVPGDTTGTTQQPQVTPAPTVTTTDPDDLNIQIGDLTGNLEDYLGQTVSVRGEVVEAIDDNAFILRDPGLFGGEDVIVFNTTGAPIVLPPDGSATERFQVTGEVQQIVLDNIAQQHGLVLNEDIYGDYENSPAIIAESVALAPEPGEISDNPEAFYNQLIAVQGELGEQYDMDTFTIRQPQFFGGADVLVVGDTPGATTNVTGAEEVVIMGVLRPFNIAEFERDYNLAWDTGVRQTIETDYSQEPVLVAEQIFPLIR